MKIDELIEIVGYKCAPESIRVFVAGHELELNYWDQYHIACSAEPIKMVRDMYWIFKDKKLNKEFHKCYMY